ncbi:MAG: 3-phosphoshikimate 1-carboxyvinyltransferase [Actinomycetota bacterium]|nr:3-phosphoshikimate 1-carboxyvinyltransferase [Actinomycetota bacterium]
MNSRLIAVKTGPVEATVRPPGSKSLTIRALFTAASAAGTSHLGHPLESGDTVAAREAVRSLGVSVEEAEENWEVVGTGGVFVATPHPIDVGESGLTARSLVALAALVPGSTRIVGQGRLPQRPMGGLIEALHALGVTVRSDNGGVPLEVEGSGVLHGGTVKVAAGDTSQFATALLLVAPLAVEPITVIIDDLQGSAGYLDLTEDVMTRFGAKVERIGEGFRVQPTGYQAADYEIEPDASAAVYPLVAAAIRGGTVTVSGLDGSSLQPDIEVIEVLTAMGCRIAEGYETTTIEAGGGPLNPIDIDLSGMPDGALAVAVACLFARGQSRLHGLASLRHKESDRLRALAEQLQNLGAGVRVEEDSLVISPGPLHPARIDTYGDHRIAMAFSLAGLVQPGVEIESPGVVDKTWPGFWEMLESL